MRLLTVREAAERLHVSMATVYLLCTERRLVHVRFGGGRGTIRIREDDLESYIQEAVVR